MAQPAQSSGPFFVRPTADAMALSQDINRQLAQITSLLDSRMGFRGAMDVHNILDMRGNGITNVASQSTLTAAATVSQIKGLQEFLDELQRQLTALKRRVDALDTGAFTEGAFTITGTGFAVNPTGEARYVQAGKLVTLFIPTLSGTSNAATFTLTGLPATITPVHASNHVATITDGEGGGTDAYGLLQLAAGSATITLYSPVSATGAWTASGTKGVIATLVAYHLF
jgi:hypothetical protein